MNLRIRRLCLPLFFFLLGSSLPGANPDLALAPLPKLSNTAWHELQGAASEQGSVTLHTQIVANKGKILAVSVSEVGRWPVTSDEVQSWITRHWKFVGGFSGTVVQPISFKVVRAETVATTPVKMRAEPGHAVALLERSPKPIFPDRYQTELQQYARTTGYKAGVLLQMTVRDGAIVDMRVVDQKGPTDFCEYTVNWVRTHWLFKPAVNGTFTLPVYYGFE
jgi:hypothetical protein